MKNLHALALGITFVLSSVLAGCGAPADAEGSSQAAITKAKLCGTKTCAKQQACCDGPSGPYCTTTACTEEAAEADIAKVSTKLCGTKTCAREQSCCDSARGPYCTTTACTQEDEVAAKPVEEAVLVNSKVCGKKICSKYESCCDGAYCTTEACNAN